MLKISKELRDAVINIIAQARHNYSYAEIAQLLKQLQELQEESKKSKK